MSTDIVPTQVRQVVLDRVSHWISIPFGACEHFSLPTCAQPQTMIHMCVHSHSHKQQIAEHVCVPSHSHTYNRLLYVSVCPATATRTTDCYTCLCAQPQPHLQQTAIHVCVPSHRQTHNRLLYMCVYRASLDTCARQTFHLHVSTAGGHKINGRRHKQAIFSTSIQS